MTRQVTVIDYGVGNLFSVRRALEKCDAQVLVTDDPEKIMNSARIVLPGVGAFADGMRGLVDRGLDMVIREYAKSGRPLLGICLGMQMLGTISEEFGVHDGLAIISGRVAEIPRTGSDGIAHKIPHIGWASLEMPRMRNGWKGTILEAIEPGDSVYLVHSFAITPTDDADRLADCTYNGRIISAAIQSGNVIGCQFHPEKSGSVGLKILDQFLT